MSPLTKDLIGVGCGIGALVLLAVAVLFALAAWLRRGGNG